MISVALLGHDNRIIHTNLKDLAARLTEESWDMKEQPPIDMGCVDFDVDGVSSALLSFRSSYSEAMLLILADSSVSPMEYLRPGIRADSLIIKPLTNEKVLSVLKELLNVYLDRASVNSESIFTIQEGDELWRIPYKDIYYFESKEKRLFVRTLYDEYGFYSTLDYMEGQLPVQFKRSHRSYIVNTDKLKNVFLSKNYIELLDGFSVPLSRSYKHIYKGMKAKPVGRLD